MVAEQNFWLESLAGVRDAARRSCHCQRLWVDPLQITWSDNRPSGSETVSCSNCRLVEAVGSTSRPRARIKAKDEPEVVIRNPYRACAERDVVRVLSDVEAPDGIGTRVNAGDEALARDSDPESARAVRHARGYAGERDRSGDTIIAVDQNKRVRRRPCARRHRQRLGFSAGSNEDLHDDDHYSRCDRRGHDDSPRRHRRAFAVTRESARKCGKSLEVVAVRPKITHSEASTITMLEARARRRRTASSAPYV